MLVVHVEKGELQELQRQCKTLKKRADDTAARKAWLGCGCRSRRPADQVQAHTFNVLMFDPLPLAVSPRSVDAGRSAKKSARLKKRKKSVTDSRKPNAKKKKRKGSVVDKRTKRAHPFAFGDPSDTEEIEVPPPKRLP